MRATRRGEAGVYIAVTKRAPNALKKRRKRDKYGKI